MVVFEQQFGIRLLHRSIRSRLVSGKLTLTYLISLIKGTSINCLRPLRGLKRVAARRDLQERLVALFKNCNAADACFRPRPVGLSV